jgi:hypothetical protein
MRSPSLNLFGTFFPSWMLCAFIGIFAAIVVWGLLKRTPLAAEVKPPLVAYPSIALSVTFLVWLSVYGQ